LLGRVRLLRVGAVVPFQQDGQQREQMPRPVRLSSGGRRDQAAQPFQGGQLQQGGVCAANE
jgi:hypothetical protein